MHSLDYRSSTNAVALLGLLLLINLLRVSAPENISSIGKTISFIFHSVGHTPTNDYFFRPEEIRF